MPVGRNGTGSRWFRTLKRSARPALRVACFPHLGGTANFFLPWARLVPNDVEVLAVCYPGREERLSEPPAELMEHLTVPIAEECAAMSGPLPVFFGHSMGAAVAYETTIRLREHHGVAPPTLFVSGCAAPGREELDDLADAPAEQLIEKIGSLDGTDSEVFTHPELVDLILPSVRADYRLANAYLRAYDPSAAPRPVSVPLTAYYGTQDPEVKPETVAEWASYTTSTFDVREFDGGHFYLVPHAETLVRDLVLRASARHR
jgi:pyochelin biosynthetic protein PchC